MKKIWILGAGKFGRIAAEALHRKNEDADITIIEKSENACRQLPNVKHSIICTDAIDFLTENLKTQDEPDWIIPVIPVHVAFEWIKARLLADYRLEKLTVPDQLAMALPNPCRGNSGRLYISHADFRCPDNCPQPKNRCTHTAKARPTNLYKKLDSLNYADFNSVVVRSWQLAPGVGGYKPLDLFKALDSVRSSRKPVLLSTACGCHGVVDAFTITPKKRY
jgi:hypothetical protein